MAFSTQVQNIQLEEQLPSALGGPPLTEKPGSVDDDQDAFLVAFAEPYDPANPKDWTLRRKWSVTCVLSVSGLNRIMVSTIMAPALTTIAVELHMTHTEAVGSMVIYLLATVFGPLFIGPLSEMYGRAPILHATNIWFLAWNIACGFANTKVLLLSARFLAGLGASAIYALGSGVLGDVWRPEQRGRSLGLYLLIPLLGAALGPILGGIITQYSTWRWMFWSTSIVQAAMVLLSLRLFHETHAPTILHKRAKAMRVSTSDERYSTVFERLDAGRFTASLLRHSLTRPLRLLLNHRLIQLQALLAGLNYGITYFVLSTYADLWTILYHSSPNRAGLHYLSLCAGEMVGSQVGAFIIDAVYKRYTHRHGNSAPEARIPVLLPAVLLTPAGLILYGWSAQYVAPWPVVDLGGFVASFAGQISGQALQAYTIDAYPDHVGSASAATQLFRSAAAFGFPLVAPTAYAKLGYGVGNSALAGVAIAVGGPVVGLLWWKGRGWREGMHGSY